MRCWNSLPRRSNRTPQSPILHLHGGPVSSYVLRQASKGPATYGPAHFAAFSTEALHDLIEENPFGILVRGAESCLDADHVPFLLDRSREAFGRLHCHVARANPIWKAIVGTEIEITKLTGKFKLSQNKEARDIAMPARC